MKRTKESFVTKINEAIPLSGKTMLEIGCGTGNYTRQLAKICHSVFAIDPNFQAIRQAQELTPDKNVTFQIFSAEDLSRLNEKFDIVVFTLSLHHVPVRRMARAIDQAMSVTQPSGRIVFLEPAENGSFFEAEITFDAADGDEREVKRAAYANIKRNPRLSEIAELDDQTEFTWDSLEDFLATMRPKKNLDSLDQFLKKNDYTLNAERRINIVSVTTGKK